MIGVETIHTFQLVFFGMVFSRRYSNYFNNFDELLFTVGQSSPLFSESNYLVPYRLAFMKYSNFFEDNLTIVASSLGLALLLWTSITILKRIWEDRLDSLSGEELRAVVKQKDEMGKVRRIFSDYLLLPISLSFYYHLVVCLVCQSYLYEESESTEVA